MLPWCGKIYKAFRHKWFYKKVWLLFCHNDQREITSSAAGPTPFHQRLTKGWTDSLISNRNGGNDLCLLAPRGISGSVTWFEGMEVSQIMAH